MTLEMKESIIIICLLSIIISSQGLRTRIYRGSNAPEGKYPYFAYLYNSYTYCGGSIIGKRWILTAAHCFETGDPRTITVMVGSTSLTRKDGTVYKVEKRIVHEAYDEETVENDIALLRVDKDIEYNNKVQPITLAERGTRIADRESVVMTGFGRLADKTQSERLQSVVLTVFGYSACKKVEPNIVETEICTLHKSGKGPCIGDSGGPLVNKNGIQIGIDSHAFLNNCGVAPEIYTKVSSFRDWIDKKIRQY